MASLQIWGMSLLVVDHNRFHFFDQPFGSHPAQNESNILCTCDHFEPVVRQLTQLDVV